LLPGLLGQSVNNAIDLVRETVVAQPASHAR